MQHILGRMNTIKPGMTRQQLLTVFAPSGGMSTDVEASFDSLDCYLFRVDVTFRLTGKPDAQGRTVASPSDLILTMSRFYVDYDPMS